MAQTNSKTLLLASATILIASFSVLAVAEARPSTKSYTCNGVKNFIADRGAVVMNHKASHLYRRFVANRGFCKSTSRFLKAFSVPTKSGRCTLRICVDINPFGSRN